MTKPTAVIDKCLLQPICASQDAAWSKHCLRFLTEHFTVYAPPMLIEEVAANYYSPSEIPKDLAVKMLAAISDFHWMEHPLELTYQEVVLKKDISAGFDLNPLMAGKYCGWIKDLNAHLPELEELFHHRYERKVRLREQRKAFQDLHRLKDPANPDSLNFPSHAAFVQHVLGFMGEICAVPKLKAKFFADFLGRTFRRWHPDQVSQANEALADINLGDLTRRPFMHDYVLTYLLYLSGPVTLIGPEESRPSNSLVLSGNPINNDEDADYVVSAQVCDYLLTCDKRMHKMAGLLNPVARLKHAGPKQRRAVLIPRTAAERGEELLKHLESLL